MVPVFVYYKKEEIRVLPQEEAQTQHKELITEEWKVFSNTSPLGMTGDYMSDCGISNDTMSFYCDKPDDITNEELQEICDKLNSSIVNERKDSAGSDTIEFKDWCDKNTWEHEMRDETYYTTKELYKIFQESQPKQKEESEKELEERTERNMNVISAFCEHLESENIVIPESAVLSFFNA